MSIVIPQNKLEMKAVQHIKKAKKVIVLLLLISPDPSPSMLDRKVIYTPNCDYSSFFNLIPANNPMNPPITV
jgi:hypothetical protein